MAISCNLGKKRKEGPYQTEREDFNSPARKGVWHTRKEKREKRGARQRRKGDCPPLISQREKKGRGRCPVTITYPEGEKRERESQRSGKETARPSRGGRGREEKRGGWLRLGGKDVVKGELPLMLEGGGGGRSTRERGKVREKRRGPLRSRKKNEKQNQTPSLITSKEGSSEDRYKERNSSLISFF